MPTVPPRVIPLFIEELAACSIPSFRREHILQFTSRLSEVFACRVTDEDVMDLIVALISFISSIRDSTIDVGPPTAVDLLRSERSDSLAFHALRLLAAVFDVNAVHSPRVYAVLRSLSDALNRRRACEEEKKAAEQRRVHVLGLHYDQYNVAVQAAKDEPVVSEVVPEVDHSPQEALPEPASSRLTAALASEQDNRLNMVKNAEAIFLDASKRLVLHMDHLLSDPALRLLCLALWRQWDSAGCDLEHFTAFPDRLHLYVGTRSTSRYRVYRDFVMCPLRRIGGPDPSSVTRLYQNAGKTSEASFSLCHIKTNIPKKSEVMYRILVEGYNYGVNAPIQSDCVGYTNRNWEELGCMEAHGWPEGWDAGACCDYAPGVQISQYYSSDGFVTVRLRAKSLFCVGFSVSAWLVFEGRGAGFPITAVIHHQDYDL